MSLSIADLAELRQRLTSGFGPIESEVMAEKASSLGYHGRLVEKAMTALKAFDAAPGSADERLILVKAAARDVWKFFVRARRAECATSATRSGTTAFRRKCWRGWEQWRNDARRGCNPIDPGGRFP